jgi:hypothetical protein
MMPPLVVVLRRARTAARIAVTQRCGETFIDLLLEVDLQTDANSPRELLEPTTYAAVSLAELYAQTGRWNDVVELTEGVKNEDNASALLLVF